MNKVHETGDMVTGIFMVLVGMNARQGFLYLEDSWFQDMNSINWKVWVIFYLPWISGLIANYYMQIFYLGSDIKIDYFKNTNLLNLLSYHNQRPRI